MRLSLRDIETYAKCPRLFSYIGHKESTLEITDRHKIIYDAYHYRAFYDKSIPWTSIRSQVGRLLFREENLRVPRKVENALAHYSHWYKNYMKDSRQGIAGVNAFAAIGSNVIYEPIPLTLLKSDKHNASILFVCNEAPTFQEVYDSIYYRGLLWLISNYLEIEVKQIQFNTISETTKTFTIHKGHDSIGHIIADIVLSISENRYWPSKGANCINCRYAKECIL